MKIANGMKTAVGVKMEYTTPDAPNLGVALASKKYAIWFITFGTLTAWSYYQAYMVPNSAYGDQHGWRGDPMATRLWLKGQRLGPKALTRAEQAIEDRVAELVVDPDRAGRRLDVHTKPVRP